MKWGQLSVPVSSDATLLFQNVNDDTAVAGGTTAPKTHATIKFVVDNTLYYVDIDLNIDLIQKNALLKLLFNKL